MRKDRQEKRNKISHDTPTRDRELQLTFWYCHLNFFLNKYISTYICVVS